MPLDALHTQYIIKCPKNVDPTLINPKGFQDFIPPNVTVVEVRGLTRNQHRRPCIWEFTATLPGGEAVYYDNVERYNLRLDLDNYKPRNTNLLKEKMAIRNGEIYWIFEYEVVCRAILDAGRRPSIRFSAPNQVARAPSLPVYQRGSACTNILDLLFINGDFDSCRPVQPRPARVIPIMSSRSKEKVTAMFRKLFKSSSKEGEGSSKQSPGSPARRLLRGCRDSVSPGSPKKEETGQKSVRARRLMKEYRDLQRLQSAKAEPVFTVELVDDNLFEWHVKVHKLDAESELGCDMRELGIGHILLHLVFPENFPFAPPFMRVISPRIEKGFVMEGGAICMELLTPRGWASAYTVEAVIMQFAASVVKGQGRVQRKNKGQKGFSRRTAEESFRSLVKTHDKYGWVTPSLADG